MNKKALDTLINDIQNIINAEYEIIGGEYVKENGENYLRFYIDKTTGMSIDDCESLSKIISEYLDKHDPINESYYLEVSSPGIDRELKTKKDFIREKGKAVDVKFYKTGEYGKQITAVLAGLDENGNILLDFDGRDIAVDKDEIAKINLHIEF